MVPPPPPIPPLSQYPPPNPALQEDVIQMMGPTVGQLEHYVVDGSSDTTEHPNTDLPIPEPRTPEGAPRPPLPDAPLPPIVVKKETGGTDAGVICGWPQHLHQPEADSTRHLRRAQHPIPPSMSLWTLVPHRQPHMTILIPPLALQRPIAPITALNSQALQQAVLHHRSYPVLPPKLLPPRQTMRDVSLHYVPFHRKSYSTRQF